jgi:hypothetical protein
MNYDDCSVDELIELGSVAAPGVFSQLSSITAGASADGVTVRVNLEGRLVGLELAPSALAAGPVELAGTIFRLTQEASAAALNVGIEVLAPLAGEELTAELRALTLPEPVAAEPVAPAPVDDDFAEVASWAVPR